MNYGLRKQFVGNRLADICAQDCQEKNGVKKGFTTVVRGKRNFDKNKRSLFTMKSKGSTVPVPVVSKTSSIQSKKDISSEAEKHCDGIRAHTREFTGRTFASKIFNGEKNIALSCAQDLFDEYGPLADGKKDLDSKCEQQCVIIKGKENMTSNCTQHCKKNYIKDIIQNEEKDFESNNDIIVPLEKQKEVIDLECEKYRKELIDKNESFRHQCITRIEGMCKSHRSILEKNNFFEDQIDKQCVDYKENLTAQIYKKVLSSEQIDKQCNEYRNQLHVSLFSENGTQRSLKILNLIREGCRMKNIYLSYLEICSLYDKYREKYKDISDMMSLTQHRYKIFNILSHERPETDLVESSSDLESNNDIIVSSEKQKEVIDLECEKYRVELINKNTSELDTINTIIENMCNSHRLVLKKNNVSNDQIVRQCVDYKTRIMPQIYRNHRIILSDEQIDEQRKRYRVQLQETLFSENGKQRSIGVLTLIRKRCFPFSENISLTNSEICSLHDKFKEKYKDIFDKMRLAHRHEIFNIVNRERPEAVETSSDTDEYELIESEGDDVNREGDSDSTNNRNMRIL